MISRLRVRIDIAAKNVPFTTIAHVPRMRNRKQLPRRAQGTQVVKNDEQRRHQRFQDATKIKLPIALARNSEFAGAGETRYASST